MVLSGRQPLVVASRPPLVTHLDARRRAVPLFPDRQEEAYRRDLFRRVNAAQALLMTRIGRALRKVGEDIDARAAERRRDSEAEDLSTLIRVIDEAERDFAKANEPDAKILASTGAKVDTFTAAQVARTVKAVAGIDVVSGGITMPVIEAWADANVSLIKTIDARFFADIREVTVEAVRSGRSTRDLIADIQERYSVSKSRAEVIARDQVGTLNAQITQAKQTGLGITKYIWRTLRDERVRGRPGGKYPNARPSHWSREGQTFEWAKPPSESSDDGHPGEPIMCRCTAEPVLE